MSHTVDPVMGYDALETRSSTPLVDCDIPSVHVRGVVGAGSVTHNITLGIFRHVVRHTGQTSRTARTAIVVDRAISGTVGLQDGDVLAAGVAGDGYSISVAVRICGALVAGRGVTMESGDLRGSNGVAGQHIDAETTTI